MRPTSAGPPHQKAARVGHLRREVKLELIGETRVGPEVSDRVLLKSSASNRSIASFDIAYSQSPAASRASPLSK